MNALIAAYYGSAEFKGLRSSTARVYRRILERFREAHGDKDAAGMQPRHNGGESRDAGRRKSPSQHALDLDLHAALDLCPRDRLTFIAQADGRPLGAASLGNEFHNWLRRGPGFLRNYLRKAAARRLAEAGSTVHEIAAVTGHKTLSEVARYTREAEKTRLAAESHPPITIIKKKVVSCRLDP